MTPNDAASAPAGDVPERDGAGHLRERIARRGGKCAAVGRKSHAGDWSRQRGERPHLLPGPIVPHHNGAILASRGEQAGRGLTDLPTHVFAKP